MTNVKAILIIAGFLVITFLLGASFWQITKSEAQNLVFASAYTITENVADSADFLDSLGYDGIVVYNPPRVDCEISVSGNHIITESLIDQPRFREAPTMYSLFVHHDMGSPYTVECSPLDGTKIVIKTVGDDISVEAGE